METTAVRGAIRMEADRLEARKPTSQFRRRRGDHVVGYDERLTHEVVARARMGDPDALRLLYLRHADDVFSYASSIVGDEHAAEDVTQIVFGRLERRLQNYHPAAVPLAAWITRVTHNAAIDYLRAQRTVPCAEVVDHDAEADDSSFERIEAIREAFGSLPSNQREILLMRFVLGMTAREVGDSLRRSQAEVYRLQYRGARHVREELTRLESAPVTCAG
jgi:RNA polymerase sigma-70 factor, ECF subfamily